MPATPDLPQLSYPGKQPRHLVLSATPGAGLRPAASLADLNHALIIGDNLPLLANLVRAGLRADLIYADPPYATGRSFANGDGQLQYHDRLLGAEYCEWLRRRLIWLRETLSERGTLYLQMGTWMGPYARVLLDEVFGAENFLSEIARVQANPKRFERRAYGAQHDLIYVYARQRGDHIWNDVRLAVDAATLQRRFPKIAPDGRRYTTVPLHAPGEVRSGETGGPWRGVWPPPRTHWQRVIAGLEELDAAGRVEWSRNGKPRRINWADDYPGERPQNVWPAFKDPGERRSSYSTEKNAAMLDLIVAMSSTADSLVLDPFAGSGSTLLAAARAGRGYLGIDESPQAEQAAVANFALAGQPLDLFRLV